MSTTAVTAGQIMDRVANLLNDPNKTDYTYDVMLPYLNMAIEELAEIMEESNAPVTNVTSAKIIIPKAYAAIVWAEYPNPDPLLPRYPADLVEIQEIGEREVGSTHAFRRLPKLEFLPLSPSTNSLLYWNWESQVIKFNQSLATVDMEVQLRYITPAIQYVANANSTIYLINCRSYLAYKTAAFCARFIGENESRAGVLNDESDKAVERIEGINNKGKQQIMTRHRPFRANYKSRGGF
jgi:hypothetical protein